MLDLVDLSTVEQALPGMRALTLDEERLLDASRAAEARRKAVNAQQLERLRVARRRVYALLVLFIISLVLATIGWLR